MVQPFTRMLCVFIDAQGYSRRDDRGQSALQAELVDVLDTAASAVGLDRSRWHRQPSGDGELALIPADQPETAVVQDFTLRLASLLFGHNAGRVGGDRLRLRMAIDHGLVQQAPNGFSGATVVAVSRLVNSAAARAALAKAAGAPLVQVLSDRVYTDIVAAGHAARTAEFRLVPVREKEFQAEAWVRVPGFDPPETDEPQSAESARGQVVTAHFAGPVKVSGGVIGINNH
ncbi:hypothetical protein [Actinokineospora sp. HUAS TT18]|uniref:hypothetical protein n=1 Tax=Actinokineospora sp. HUAS TT18 TaxID=3447451 RepID=UPI003F5216C3